MSASTPFLKWLHEVELKDIDTVGGKNASLGEMIQNLGKLGVNVPGGFVVTVASYEAFIAHNDLDDKIRDIVSRLDVEDVENIRRTGLQVRTLIKNGRFPAEIEQGIVDRYFEMSQHYGQDATDVAVHTHGGNGLASEYGLGTLIAASRLMRIAPVSREMILNFVAQHSLGLPKSY